MSPAWTSRAALALAFMGGSLAGCGSSPDTRFYTLATVPPITKTADRSSTPQVGVGIRSVVLPADLDRPQIVTRTGPNTVHLAEFDRWSSRLRVGGGGQEPARRCPQWRDCGGDPEWQPRDPTEPELKRGIYEHLEGSRSSRSGQRARRSSDARGSAIPRGSAIL